MFNKKCSACAKKIERKFSYCPYCGVGFKQKQERENFGMLGRDDSNGEVREEMKLPFGLNGIINSLMKQLEKEMGNMQNMNPSSQKVPGGFKIQISTGKPKVQQVVRQPEKIIGAEISEKELIRRERLKRVDAESRVRRLSDRIVYEITTPGVKKNKDVTFTKLEDGLEIRAYSKDKCYVKIIPLKVEVIGCYIKKDILFVELKS